MTMTSITNFSIQLISCRYSNIQIFTMGDKNNNVILLLITLIIANAHKLTKHHSPHWTKVAVSLFLDTLKLTL